MEGTEGTGRAYDGRYETKTGDFLGFFLRRL